MSDLQVLFPENGSDAVFSDGRVMFVGRYEPGNATSYHLVLMPLSNKRPLWAFAWLNAPSHGRACILNFDSDVHAGYLAEKLGLDEERRSVDIRAILTFLAHVAGFHVHIDKE